MRFKCNNEKCGKTFIYPAKKTDAADPEKGLFTAIAGMMCAESKIEIQVCPYCQSLNFDEIEVEKPTQPEITSVKSVSLDEVDGMLKEGYVVENLYAKTATLVKREKAENE